MADAPSYIADPVHPEYAASPLAGHLEKGDFGAQSADEPGVTLSERVGLSICEIAAWRGEEETAVAAIGKVSGLKVKADAIAGMFTETANAFTIAPGRWLVAGTAPGLVARLADEAGSSATVTDLSHGRVIIRVDGARSRWVLSKLFAIDLADEAFQPGAGCATQHHDIFAQIQRTGPDAFDICVFRSFARSFWHMLCRSAEEVGYRVA